MDTGFIRRREEQAQNTEAVPYVLLGGVRTMRKILLLFQKRTMRMSKSHWKSKSLLMIM